MKCVSICFRPLRATYDFIFENDIDPNHDSIPTIIMPVTAATKKASEAIPYLLRFPLLWLEPLFSLNGSILTYMSASTYTKTMTRGALPIIQPNSQFIYTELAGGWLYFAFTEAVVLRLVDDVRVWRLLCIGMILSDIAYTHSCAEALGGWSEFLILSKWTAEDWAVALATWPFLFARIAIVLGIGERMVGPAGKKTR